MFGVFVLLVIVAVAVRVVGQRRHRKKLVPTGGEARPGYTPGLFPRYPRRRL